MEFTASNILQCMLVSSYYKLQDIWSFLSNLLPVKFYGVSGMFHRQKAVNFFKGFFSAWEPGKTQISQTKPIANIHSCTFIFFQQCQFVFGFCPISRVLCFCLVAKMSFCAFQKWHRPAQFQSISIARTMNWPRTKTLRQAVVYDERNHRELRELRHVVF